MKRITLIISAFLNLFCLTLVAQETNYDQLDTKIKRLENSLKNQHKTSVQFSAEIKTQQAKIQELEKTNNELNSKLVEQLNAFSSKIENIASENKKNSEIQELKIEELKTALNSKNFNLYLYIAIALVLALILFVYFMKMAINKAITEQKGNWSDFMNFIVKR